MAVGVAVGLAGGLALLAFMRRVPLPSEGLYSPRVLAGVLVIFGAATVAHGSGFLAVLVAGIIIGDEPAPYKREIERFHSSLASLAEIVAFVMLGLTMRLSQLASASAWADGLALAALLAFVIRPVLGGLVSLPVSLTVPERVFFLWTGLKGAVPILLGMAIVESGTPGAACAYQVIFVIVGFSVTVQGGLVPTLAHRLRIPLRSIEPEPWSLGVRFSEEPEGLHRYHVARAPPPTAAPVDDLPCGENAWVSLVIRDGSLLTRWPATPPCGPATTSWSSPTPTRPRPLSAASPPRRTARHQHPWCTQRLRRSARDTGRGTGRSPEDNSAGEGT